MRLLTETSKELRKTNMKPPETVTIIDLKGKVLYIIDPKEARHSNAYVRTYNKYENSQPHVVYSGDKTYVPMHPRKTQIDRTYDLSNFLNDQLTFIRNGMWETLAIYQATLGRYWKVPWYEPPDVFTLKLGRRYHILESHGNHNVAYYGTMVCRYGDKTGFFSGQEFNTDIQECEYGGLIETIETVTAYKPTVDEFLKHYPDVFSKLTPYEGE